VISIALFLIGMCGMRILPSSVEKIGQDALNRTARDFCAFFVVCCGQPSDDDFLEWLPVISLRLPQYHR
jgi:hypothetical protein